MTKTVTISVATTVSQTFPAGTVISGVKFAMVDGPNHFVAITPTAPWTTTFNNVPAGNYSIVVNALDAAGVALGNSVLGNVVVTEDTVTVDVPVSLSVTVA